MRFILKSIVVLCAWGGVLVSNLANAQTVRCSGTVTDQSGIPIPGAAIVEQGSSTNGVISDADGLFSITVPTGKSLEIR